MLRVSVNLKQGVYVISENGEQKTIQVPIDGKYDKNTIKATRQEIQSNNRHIIAKEKLESIDVGVYQAIKQFDSQYGTNYAYNYAKALGEEIFHTHYDISSKDYKKKMAGIRAEELKKADVNIQYNVSLLGGLGKLKFGERIRAIRTALSQKRNGVNVQFANSKQPLLQAPIVQQKTIDLDDDIPEMPPMPKMPDIPEVPDIPDNPKVPDMPASENKANIIENNETIDTLKNEVEEKITIEPAPAVEELQKAIDGRRVASPSRGSQQQAQKKKISRSKAIQASKQAHRESVKLKNRYKDMQKVAAEKRARAADPEQIRLVAERKAAKEEQNRLAEEARRAIKAEQKRQARIEEQKAKTRARAERELEAERNKKSNKILALSKIGAKSQEGSFVTRFTRIVKDQTDSIRNKKFIPNLTNNQKKIAKAVTIVGLMATLAIGSGIGTYKILNKNSNSINTSVDNPKQVETVKPGQDIDKDGIDYILGEQNEDTKDYTQNSTTQNQTKPSTPVQEEVKSGTPIQEEVNSGTPVNDDTNYDETKKDSKKEYLSSIKVGASMSINSGRYFETPEGQGNYGHFEKYKDSVKEINKIDVITEDGYKIITDSDVNVYELKQQYPNAKFAYHIISKNQDGSTTILGWLTEASMDQSMEQQQNMAELDDMDR